MPPGVVTVTSTVPVPAGLSAVIEVALSTLKSVAAVVPKSTAVAPVKLVPVIATEVPPASEPEVGFRAVTVGGESRILDSIHSIRGRHDFVRFRLPCRCKRNELLIMASISKAVPSRPENGSESRPGGSRDDFTQRLSRCNRQPAEPVKAKHADPAWEIRARR